MIRRVRMRGTRVGVAGCLVALLVITLGYAPRAHATTFTVNTESDLRNALNPTTGAQNGDTISFNANVTLTADLPIVQKNVTILGNSHTLLGNNNTHRGLIIGAFSGSTQVAVQVTIQDLTIQNATALGGAGGNGNGGGGGGAGLGGALFVANGGHGYAE